MRPPRKFLMLLLGLLPAVFNFSATEAAPVVHVESSTWDVLLANEDAKFEPGPAAASAPVGTVRPKTAELTVRPHGLPAEAQTAVDAAAAIWERQFASQVETIVDVSWSSELATGVLGRSRFRGFIKDDGDDSKLPVDGVLYPAALAHAVRGVRFDSEPDIVVELNAKAPWYYGTDGRTAANTYDLVTVVMHEVGQGLGFSSRIDIVQGKAQARGGILSIYDTFLVDYKARPFSSLLEHDNGALVQSVTGGDAYFSGSYAKEAAGKAPKLYAPGIWTVGSSLSHLDETEYNIPNANALMAPFFYFAWATHDPGPIALAMMRDMGWTIPGLGQPARLGIDRLPAAMQSGSRVNVVVTVQDPLGSVVTTDNSTVVSFGAYRNKSTTNWGCIGETSGSKVVSNGTASWKGCYFEGSGLIVFVADAADLARGRSNAVMQAVSLRTLAMLGRDP